MATHPSFTSIANHPTHPLLPCVSLHYPDHRHTETASISSTSKCTAIYIAPTNNNTPEVRAPILTDTLRFFFGLPDTSFNNKYSLKSECF